MSEPVVFIRAACGCRADLIDGALVVARCSVHREDSAEESSHPPIHTTGEIVWDAHADGFGTSLQGYLKTPYRFEELVARLITLSGQPAKSFDEYKTSVQFTGLFRGHVFTLYDYKEDAAIHIGATSRAHVADLPAVLQPLLAAVVPTPYDVPTFYDRKQPHRFPVRGRRAR